MAKYAVSDEGVIALRQLSQKVSSCCEITETLIINLKNVCENKQQTLGPHYPSIEGALADIQGEVSTAETPALEISNILLDIADTYDEIISNDKIKASQQQAGKEKGASLFSRFFGGKKDGSNSSRSFGPYAVDKHGFIQGSNHEKFLQDWEGYDPDAFETIMFEGNEVVESINPSSIEGINISQYDIDNPGSFWSQHQTGGTKESFVEIASHIPKVRAEIESGRSISDLLEDEDLGVCTAIYFDPSNMTQVIKHDGFYEFQSNGRHRVLAARELGLEIPVKIIGARKRKQ